MLAELDGVISRARECRACPRMSPCAVLSRASGPAPADVMFVGEAPGRFGAARTGVPFLGDAAGARFERLLAAAGLRRGDVFVTNAVLCLPLDPVGRNRTPTRREVRACSPWLADTIAAVDPALVVAMGGQALKALQLVQPHELALTHAAARPSASWAGRVIAVVYHPGARAQVHRPWEAQVEDWRGIGAWLSDHDRRRMLHT